ncbi:hypothetical protein TruAng_008308 [Truncatella angustata]|nr:hypothetical protein TruAng_008308 [Truncatella angustata]
MVITTNLRPQAPEFQPQRNKQSIGGIPSGSNTAVPTPTRTPQPTTKVASDAAQQIADKVAADHRGSFSTLSESTTAATYNNPISEEACSPKAILTATDSSASSSPAKAKNVRRLIHDDEPSQITVSAPHMENTRIDSAPAAAHVRRRPPQAQQFYVPSASAATQFSPVYGFSYPYGPSVSPYSYQAQPYYHVPFANTGMATNLVNPQGQTIMSAGPDPISEGRRIYIGNLKYSVNRHGVKRLLRAHGVNESVEKIYMPYSDTPLESSCSVKDGRGGSLADSPARAAYPSTIPLDRPGESQRRESPGDLPNKGFVFVTYSNVLEAEEAIQRLSGVIHLGRRLVCRPGLPKGVAFRQADVSSESGFYNGGKRRRQKTFRGGRSQDFNEDQDYGYGHGNGYHYDSGSYGGGRYGEGYAPRGSMDSGYRSAPADVYKTSPVVYYRPTYTNGNYGY